MSSRTKRILQAALAIQKDVCQLVSDQENNQNISNLSFISENCPQNDIFNEVLSPEEVEEIIRDAEIVFDDGFVNVPENNNNTYINQWLTQTNEFVICNQQLEKKIGQNDETQVKDRKQNEQEAADKEQIGLGVLEREDIDNLKDMENCPEQETVGTKQNSEQKQEDQEKLEDKEEWEKEGGDSDDEVSESDTVSNESTTSRKRKKANGYSKRKLNKKLRMTGEKYLGFRKPKNQKNTFHDTSRGERKLKPRCTCKKTSKRRCCDISELYRKKIFSKFWSHMNWDQRKVYVAHTVKVCDKSRPKLDGCRRAVTLKYHLLVSNNILFLCVKQCT